ncbi:hypothetical protein V8F20_005062, partial [Naviculisporaceae sp. PSN 640]
LSQSFNPEESGRSLDWSKTGGENRVTNDKSAGRGTYWRLAHVMRSAPGCSGTRPRFLSILLGINFLKNLRDLCPGFSEDCIQVYLTETLYRSSRLYAILLVDDWANRRRNIWSAGGTAHKWLENGRRAHTSANEPVPVGWDWWPPGGLICRNVPRRLPRARSMSRGPAQAEFAILVVCAHYCLRVHGLSVAFDVFLTGPRGGAGATGFDKRVIFDSVVLLPEHGCGWDFLACFHSGMSLCQGSRRANWGLACFRGTRGFHCD